MKEFNLDEALNGKPVKLRNGKKAYIGYKTPDYYVSDNGREIKFPLHGYIIKAYNIIEAPYMFWNINGRAYKDGIDNASDIIAMWEEPKISIEDLPKPFIPKEDNEYWVISPDCFKPLKYRAANLNHPSILNSNCFKTQEDAQKWLDFMKSMME